MKKDDYLITCLAMSIVNFTNEKNNASVETRQKNNDECFDFAVEKIEEFIKERMIKNGKYTNKR